MTDYRYLERATDPKAPLVLAFHGTGGSEHQFFELACTRLPDAHVIAVRGDVEENGMLRYFKRLAEGQYDMADLAQRTEALAALVAALRQRHQPRAVWAFGYSNGANILTSMLLAKPSLFDKAALLHPLIPWQPDAQPGLKDKAVLITAGKQDSLCPAEQTQRLADYFEGQGSQTHLVWHGGGHDIDPIEHDAWVQFFQN
ncbi:MAG: alpha/beta hydrolase [Saccharospirillum sp.]